MRTVQTPLNNGYDFRRLTFRAVKSPIDLFLITFSPPKSAPMQYFGNPGMPQQQPQGMNQMGQAPGMNQMGQAPGMNPQQNMPGGSQNKPGTPGQPPSQMPGQQSMMGQGTPGQPQMPGMPPQMPGAFGTGMPPQMPGAFGTGMPPQMPGGSGSGLPPQNQQAPFSPFNQNTPQNPQMQNGFLPQQNSAMGMGNNTMGMGNNAMGMGNNTMGGFPQNPSQPFSTNAPNNANIVDPHASPMQNILNVEKSYTNIVGQKVQAVVQWIDEKLNAFLGWCAKHLYLSGALLFLSLIAGTYWFQNVLNGSQQNIFLTLVAEAEALLLPAIISNTTSPALVSVIYNSSTQVVLPCDSLGSVLTMFQYGGPLSNYSIVSTSASGTTHLDTTKAVAISTIRFTNNISTVSNTSYTQILNSLNATQQGLLAGFCTALAVNNGFASFYFTSNNNLS